jgi:gluconate 2-dehydrogenase gamma chain
MGAMASAIGASWIAGAWGHPFAGPLRPPPAADLLARVLSPEQTRDLEALTALIIPTDDAPGAREARTVDFITRGLSSFAADQHALFEQGLADLNGRAAAQHPGKRFADIGADAQHAMALELESERSQFFEAVRVATIAGFLANPEYGGNAAKAGWRLIGFEDRFGWQPPFGYYDRDSQPE